MKLIKPIRIEPAFEDRGQIRAMFQRHAPYRAIAAYAPEGIADKTKSAEAEPSVPPMFRGNWAVSGKALVDGADAILHNKYFLDVAKAHFGTMHVCPEFVVVNVNAPMPAGNTHVDVPSFYGATRENYPLPFLRVMGCSGLFEPWRVTRAGILSWFYDGVGGNFDYWPEGLEGPMLSERPPFGNTALLADNDRMYHRIGSIGNQIGDLPRMSAAAHIAPDVGGNWIILDNGEIRATYPSHAIRFSVLWKAEIRNVDSNIDNLSLDRIMDVFTADLRGRSVDFHLPSDPLKDTAWILQLQQTYAPHAFARE